MGRGWRLHALPDLASVERDREAGVSALVSWKQGAATQGERRHHTCLSASALSPLCSPTSQLLRSSFICHLRGSETAPEVLQSAATQMKHLIDTQSSDVYDRETHDRLAKAAFDWCESVAKSFDTPAPNGAPPPSGSSSGATALPRGTGGAPVSWYRPGVGSSSLGGMTRGS